MLKYASNDPAHSATTVSHLNPSHLNLKETPTPLHSTAKRAAQTQPKEHHRYRHELAQRTTCNAYPDRRRDDPHIPRRRESERKREVFVT